MLHTQYIKHALRQELISQDFAIMNVYLLLVTAECALLKLKVLLNLLLLVPLKLDLISKLLQNLKRQELLEGKYFKFCINNFLEV